MRWYLVAVLLAAGCLGEPAPTALPEGNATAAPEAPAGDVPDAPDAPMDHAGMAMDHTWYLASDYRLVPEPPAEGVAPERIEPGGFARYVTLGPGVQGWPASAMDHAMVVEGPIEVTLVFRSATPAASASEPMFRSAGGWSGAADRWSFLHMAADAPPALEPGRTYSVTFSAAPEDAQGSFLLRPGEAFVAYPFLGYHGAQPVEYVVGGETPSKVSFRARHVPLAAATATEVLRDAGEVASAPAGAPAEVPFELPAGTVYAVVEIDGASKTRPQGFDLDLAVVAGGGSAGRSHGPTPREVVVLGPDQVAAGPSFTALVAVSGNDAGTYELVVTAYVAG